MFNKKPMADNQTRLYKNIKMSIHPLLTRYLWINEVKIFKSPVFLAGLKLSILGDDTYNLLEIFVKNQFFLGSW